MAEAEEKLDEEAAATAAEAEAFRRQQLQMKLDEKEKAEAARNAKKEAKEVKEPKPKGKAKGRPRKTDGDEKESKAPAKKKQRASADDAAEPAGAATEPVAPSTPPKRKAAADGEQKVKKPRAKKQKVGNMDVDEDLVSEFLSMMHKFDGCVYDKSFDALYKHLALNWKTWSVLIVLFACFGFAKERWQLCGNVHLLEPWSSWAQGTSQWQEGAEILLFCRFLHDWREHPAGGQGGRVLEGQLAWVRWVRRSSGFAWEGGLQCRCGPRSLSGAEGQEARWKAASSCWTIGLQHFLLHPILFCRGLTFDDPVDLEKFL